MEWSIGDSRSLTKRVTAERIALYGEAIGEVDPALADTEAVLLELYGRPVVHGMIAATFVSALVGTVIPGPGSVYLGQTLRFTAPIYVGDEVTATASISAIREDKPVITLATRCHTADGREVLTGEATVLFHEELARRVRSVAKQREEGR